jgi:hypothetical protein
MTVQASVNGVEQPADDLGPSRLRADAVALLTGRPSVGFSDVSVAQHLRRSRWLHSRYGKY